MRSALSALGRLAIVVAIAGCAGMPWQSPKSSTEPAKPSGTAATPAEPSTASTPAPPPVETARPAVPSGNGFTDHPELADVRFRSGQLSVAKADHRLLETVVRWMKQNPEAVLMVEGHTDDQGTDDGNLAAGAKRAESVRAYLISRGLDPARVTITSVGSDRPLCLEKTDACRAKNRRAHFLVKQP